MLLFHHLPYATFSREMGTQGKSSSKLPSRDPQLTGAISWHKFYSTHVISLCGLMKVAQTGETSLGNLDIHLGDNEHPVVAYCRGRRISLMTALTSNGILEYEATTGTVNAEKFMDLIRGRLVPKYATISWWSWWSFDFNSWQLLSSYHAHDCLNHLVCLCSSSHHIARTITQLKSYTAT